MCFWGPTLGKERDKAGLGRGRSQCSPLEALVCTEENSRIRVDKGALHWLTGGGQDRSPHSVAGWPRKYRDQVRWLSVTEEELGSMSSFEGVPRL